MAALQSSYHQGDPEQAAAASEEPQAAARRAKNARKKLQRQAKKAAANDGPFAATDTLPVQHASAHAPASSAHMTPASGVVLNDDVEVDGDVAVADDGAGTPPELSSQAGQSSSSGQQQPGVALKCDLTPAGPAPVTAPSAARAAGEDDKDDLVRRFSGHCDMSHVINRKVERRGADDAAKKKQGRDDKREANKQQRVQLQALISAASKGHASTVAQLLHAGAPINATDKSGKTALLVAVEGRHRRVVRLLLEKGADPNILDPAGHSLLCAACKSHDEEVMERLIMHGIDPNFFSQASRLTPLPMMASYGHWSVVQALLDAGAKIAVDLYLGQTALYFAVLAGRADVAEALLQRGADVNHPDFICKETPLKLALGLCHPGYAAEYEKNDRYEIEPMLQMTRVSRAQRVHMVALLLKHGANPNASGPLRHDRQCLLPLFSPCSPGQEAVLDMMLSHGADANKRSQDGWSALSYSARHGYLAAVRMLVGRGAAVNHPGMHPPPHEASAQGHLPVVAALLEGGAIVDAGDQAGDTALHRAAAAGQVGALTLLMKSGFDVNAVNKVEETPLAQALRAGHSEAVEQLRGGGAKA